MRSSAAATTGSRRQHDAGKLTARERIDLLFDPGTFEEVDKLVTHRCRDFGMAEQIVPGDGVVAGHGRVDGRPVFAFAQDFTVFGGSLSETNAAKIAKVMDLAMKHGRPDRRSERLGRRAHPGRRALARRLRRHLPAQHARLRRHPADLRHHGSVCRRRRVLAGDHRLHRHGSRHELHVRDRPGCGEDGHPRGRHQGAARRRHDAQRDERRRPFRGRRRPRVPGADPGLLSYLPSNNVDVRRRSSRAAIRRTATTTRSIASCRPPRTSRTTCTTCFGRWSTAASSSRCTRTSPSNIIVGFARLNGASVGLVANQPAHLAGTLDIDASVKGARFVRFCDAFNIPIVTFEDVPGFLPGVNQEYGGIIRHGAKLLYALRGSDRSEGHGHHAQGLRRRVLRDGEQAHPHRRRTSRGRPRKSR